MDVSRSMLHLPQPHTEVVLHSCCAPCSGEVMEAMLHSGIRYILYFYNPNIHPRREYDLRKDENVRFAQQHGIEFVDDDYDADAWFARARGMEHQPERGPRCTMCFDMRFVRTAQFARSRGIGLFTSSLGISRWKNMEQINSAGIGAARQVGEVEYWTFNWRKQGGAQRMIDISKRERFYQQEYCGCAYSLRDTNRARLQSGRGRIRLGQVYYGDAPVAGADAAPGSSAQTLAPPALKPAELPPSGG